MDVRADVEHIMGRIESVIESLDDLTFALLREAARNSGERPSADKTLTQARRALEKAVRLLDTVHRD